MTIKRTSTWAVPAHITGLFQIVENTDPLKMGSRGAGFSIANTIDTIIELDENSEKTALVYYNNEEIDGKVSLAVLSQFDNFWEKGTIKLLHSSKLPMQAGFGTSGGGALGSAFALNELFNSNKTSIELGQIAHKAEVECRSGLGDVIAQFHGKAEIRLEPGAPGIGKIIELPWEKDKEVLTIFLGTIATKDIITNPKHIMGINQTSSLLLNQLIENPSVELFVELSYQFSKKTGLMSQQIETIIDDLHNQGYNASMIMIGESIFVVGKSKELLNCSNYLKTNYPKAKCWLDKISPFGPEILIPK